jgi:hypothetical protein
VNEKYFTSGIKSGGLLLLGAMAASSIAAAISLNAFLRAARFHDVVTEVPD